MTELGIVVLSGGLDSATALAMAVEEHRKHRVYAITFQYGQKHSVEITCAANLARAYDIFEHKLVTLPVQLFEGGVLTTDAEIPDMRYDDLPSGQMSPTYVPFRNANLLSMATAYADSILRGIEGTARVWAGQHAEDAAGFAYADCTPEFLGAMANAIYVGTYQRVRLWTPFMHKAKHEIIRTGMELGVPYDATHSCYRGERPACGQCSTCHARLEAFDRAGFRDPLPYREKVT